MLVTFSSANELIIHGVEHVPIGYLWDLRSCNNSALIMTAVHAFLQPVLRQTAGNRH